MGSLDRGLPTHELERDIQLIRAPDKEDWNFPKHNRFDSNDAIECGYKCAPNTPEGFVLGEQLIGTSVVLTVLALTVGYHLNRPGDDGQRAPAERDRQPQIARVSWRLRSDESIDKAVAVAGAGAVKRAPHADQVLALAALAEHFVIPLPRVAELLLGADPVDMAGQRDALEKYGLIEDRHSLTSEAARKRVLAEPRHDGDQTLIPREKLKAAIETLSRAALRHPTPSRIATPRLPIYLNRYQSVSENVAG